MGIFAHTGPSAAPVIPTSISGGREEATTKELTLIEALFLCSTSFYSGGAGCKFDHDGHVPYGEPGHDLWLATCKEIEDIFKWFDYVKALHPQTSKSIEDCPVVRHTYKTLRRLRQDCHVPPSGSEREILMAKVPSVSTLWAIEFAINGGEVNEQITADLATLGQDYRLSPISAINVAATGIAGRSDSMIICCGLRRKAKGCSADCYF